MKKLILCIAMVFAIAIQMNAQDTLSNQTNLKLESLKSTLSNCFDKYVSIGYCSYANDLIITDISRNIGQDGLETFSVQGYSNYDCNSYSDFSDKPYFNAVVKYIFGEFLIVHINMKKKQGYSGEYKVYPLSDVLFRK